MKSAIKLTSSDLGVSSSALSGSPETNSIDCNQGNGYFGQVEINFQVSAGDSTSVTVTSYHSPNESDWYEYPDAEYDSAGAYNVYQRTDVYTATNGSVDYFTYYIPGGSKYVKVVWSGAGTSTITASGQIHQP